MIPIKKIYNSYFWSWCSLSTKLIATAILIVSLFNYYSDKIFETLTLFAIIVAIFKENIHNFYLPPRLSLEIAEEPRHYSEIELKNEANDVQIIAVMGIIVKNNGIGHAKNLKVLFNGLESNSLNVLIDITQSQFFVVGMVGKKQLTYYRQGCLQGIHLDILNIMNQICFFLNSLKHQMHFME